MPEAAICCALLINSKPESQLQSYVEIVFRTMTPLLLVSAAGMASLSIPTDIKQQTIHTILTKPVERFEIILGRFLGYTMLMTLVLFFMSGPPSIVKSQACACTLVGA